MSKAKLVNEAIKRKRAGLEIEYTVPEQGPSSTPDFTAVGRFGDGSRFDPVDEDELLELGWRGAERVRHNIEMKATSSKGSERGTTVDPDAQVDIQYWSGIERGVLTILLVDPTLREVRCQEPTVEYVDEFGEIHTTRFDYFGIQHDGTGIVYSVKPSHRAEAQRALMKRLEEEGLPYKPIVVTELMATEGRIENAREILNARENENKADYIEALNACEGIHGQVLFASLLKGAANIGDRRVALMLLLDRGVIWAVAGELERLTDYSYVMVNHEIRLEELRNA